MLIEQSNQLLRWLWEGIWRMSKHEHKVYLTFDDGPNPETTQTVLDTLARHHIRATFFCVGDNVRKYPKEFAKLTANHHIVGNHTMHHLKGFSTNTADYVADINEANTFIHSTLFRPPHGRITWKQMAALRNDYTIVFWDVITRDYNRKLTPARVLNIVKRYTRNGSIIVFHDSVKAQPNLFGALEPAIVWLKQQGYTFGTLDELINNKPTPTQS
ncbi:MAG: polysaccharide deacetylase family protein [Bacteroidales bacterium]|nr:polysaccharide deacetylase family protein [Bacteroidales bacterium]